MHLGKELILATKPFAKEVRWKSWYYSLSTLLILIALILGTHYMPTVWGKLTCSILNGLVMIRGFVIYHDYQHHTILYRSFPARVIFTLYGLYMLAPESIWKRSHDYHHNHNCKLFSASIGSYPIMTLEKFLEASRAEQKSYLAARHPINMLFGYFTMFIYGMCIQSFKVNPSKHWDSLLALILHAAAITAIVMFWGWMALLFTIIIPFSLSLMVGAYLFYAQHNFPGVEFKSKEEWNYPHAALESSSFLMMSKVGNWITANIGYHHIHHLNSRIPFYRLPEVMANFPELQKAKTTTFKPKDVMACLRLKLWDPNRNKMITLAEV